MAMPVASRHSLARAASTLMLDRALRMSPLSPSGSIRSPSHFMHALEAQSRDTWEKGTRPPAASGRPGDGSARAPNADCEFHATLPGKLALGNCDLWQRPFACPASPRVPVQLCMVDASLAPCGRTSRGGCGLLGPTTWITRVARPCFSTRRRRCGAL